MSAPKEPRYCLGECDDFTDHKEKTVLHEDGETEVEVECMQCGLKGTRII